ncbi:hypothetical protein QBC98_002747, partial [Kitasatospora acidiphila]
CGYIERLGARASGHTLIIAPRTNHSTTADPVIVSDRST